MKRLLVIALGLFLLAPVAHASGVSGRILLDVERNGEAWYVDPVNGERYYLGRPDDALVVMRERGLGISNEDLALFDRNSATRERLAGRILLQVESRGEAWYVDPATLRRHSLGRPEQAFDVMSSLGLGISSSTLDRIPRSDGVVNATGSVQITGVPFVPQAPFGEWSDLRQEEACEESSVYMAMAWVRGWTYIDREVARDEFIRISNWEEAKWGYYHDTSALDTMNRLFKEYYKYDNVEYREGIRTRDIIAALEDGHLVLTTINATTIGNPYFTQPGPERHMIVVTGYDASTDEFITHDPGTRRGEDFRYTRTRMEQSLRDYNSGRYVPIPVGRTAMIIVKK